MLKTGFIKILRNNQGLSTAELLVVIFIVALLAVIAIPNFVSFLNRNRFDGAIREVYEHILLARQRAITQHKRFYLDFDVTNDQYAIKSDPGNDNTFNNNDFTTVGGNGDKVFGPITPTCAVCNEDPTGPGIINLRELYKVDILAATTDFSFDSRGIASTGNKCVVLQDIPSGRTVKVIVGLIGIDTITYDPATTNCP